VLSQLFINLVGIKKIIVPGDFLSSRGAKAIKCSVKAAEGYLYPLKSSIVFIHKPVLYIRHSELRFVEFSRIGQGSSGLSRSFDVTLTKLADDSKITFMSIDKEEQECLINYFKAANVKMRTVDLETNMHEELGSDSESQNSRGAGKRKIKHKKVADEEMEDYDDEEDDEDFDDAGQSSEDEEDGEDEQEDSEMIDASISGDELKHLGKVDPNAKREKRRK
jgi:structure-specific recognition protein 1